MVVVGGSTSGSFHGFCKEMGEESGFGHQSCILCRAANGNQDPESSLIERLGIFVTWLDIWAEAIWQACKAALIAFPVCFSAICAIAYNFGLRHR